MYTIAASLGFTSLPADPEVSGTAVHRDGKITRRGTDLNSGNVADVVPSVEWHQLISARREIRQAYSILSPREFFAVGSLAFVTPSAS